MLDFSLTNVLVFLLFSFFHYDDFHFSSFYSSTHLLFMFGRVLSSHQALNNPLSFIHDVLITNSVINTLPNQCLPSIMADQSDLMLDRKLDRLLEVNCNVANGRELNRESELQIILGVMLLLLEDSELSLSVTVVDRLSSVNHS